MIQIPRKNNAVCDFMTLERTKIKRSKQMNYPKIVIIKDILVKAENPSLHRKEKHRKIIQWMEDPFPLYAL